MSTKAKQETVALKAVQAKLEVSRTEVDAGVAAVATRRERLSVDQNRLQVEQEQLQLDRKDFDAERTRLAAQLAEINGRLGRAQRAVVSAEADARTAYPSYKLSVLGELAASIDAECSVRPKPLVQITPSPSIPARPIEQSLVARPIAPCFEATVSKNKRFAQVRQIDQAALREDLKRLTEVLETTRLEAQRAYADAMFHPTGEWYFPPKLSEPVYYRNPRSLNSFGTDRLQFPDEPKLHTEWLEARRQYEIERNYAWFVNITLSLYLDDVKERKP